MATKLDEFCIKIKVDGSKVVNAELAKINKEEAKLTQNSDKTAQSINKQSAALWTFAKRLLGVYSVYQLFKKGLNLGVTFAETGNNLANMATIANVSTKNLQKWGYALKKYGGDEKTAANVLGNLQQKLTNFYQWGKQDEFATFMEHGGGTPARTPEAFLKQLSQKFKTVSKQQALDLANSIGLDPAMFNLLLNEDINKVLANAPVLYSDSDIEAARKAKEELIKFNHELEKLGVLLGRKLLPIISYSIKVLTQIIDEILNMSFLEKHFGKAGKRINNVFYELGARIGYAIDSAKESQLWHNATGLKSDLLNLTPTLPMLSPASAALGNAFNSNFNQANNIVINGAASPEIVGKSVTEAISDFGAEGNYRQWLGFKMLGGLK